MRRCLAVASLGLVSAKVYFSEDFSAGWKARWTESQWKKAEGTQGNWVKEGAGIKTKEDSRFFGIASPFESFSNGDKELIFQYSIKYTQDVECGGSYFKVGPKVDDLTTFGDPTPYNIMFGPDQCGGAKRTHLIFNYQGKNVLKRTDLPFKQGEIGNTTLYRLTVFPDNTVSVDIDGEKVYSGSLKDDFDLLLPRTIDDPTDSKPEGWVEDPMMDDPASKQPDDWVTEKRIVDPQSKKPADWDEDEDGEWEAPMIDNKEYIGEWRVERIANPEYKGVWSARQIANPEFKDDDTLYKYSDFSFIGFDLWQVKGGTIFSDILITDDKAEADKAIKRVSARNEVDLAAKEAAEEERQDKEDSKRQADREAVMQNFGDQASSKDDTANEQEAM